MCSLANHLPKRTRRFVVRLFRESELEWLYALETDEFIKRYVFGGPVRKSWPDWFNCMKEYVENGEVRLDYALAVVDCESNELVGTCGLARETLFSSDAAPSSTFDLRVLLFPRTPGREGRRGEELASALIDIAIEKLGARIFTARVDRNNFPAVQLAKELGFLAQSDDTVDEQSARMIELALYRENWIG
jgi:RimJ/RimL family protein N-acetyltransferase